MNFPEKEVYRLYQDGKNDTEIEQIIGVNRKRVGAWRKKNDLPTNPYMYPKAQKYICYDKSDAIVCMGNAAECAKTLGYKSPYVFYSVYNQFNKKRSGKYRIYHMETNDV